jgi:hypothetical protein
MASALLWSTGVVRYQVGECEVERRTNRLRLATSVATHKYAAAAAANRQARTQVVVGRAMGLPAVAAPTRRVAGDLFEAGQKEFKFAGHKMFSLQNGFRLASDWFPVAYPDVRLVSGWFPIFVT